jgi:hypothetical protein
MGHLGVERMASNRKTSRFDSISRSVAEKWFSAFVKLVDRYAPDRLLLFALNFLDKRVPSRLISFVINLVERLVPHRLRSTAIAAADDYVPDAVANSRKVSVVIAGVGKYIPDRIIPAESTERWENLRTKLHIPRLVSSKQK